MFDLLMATEMPMLIINSFLERTIGWEVGCDVYALLGAISGMGQAITNAAIAFDRYRSAPSSSDDRDLVEAQSSRSRHLPRHNCVRVICQGESGWLK